VAKFKNEDGSETEAFTQAEVDELVAGLKRKNEQLLGESRADREKREQIEKLQADGEAERAKEKGEFKTLYEKSQTELESERENARKFRTTIQEKDLDSESIKLAGSLTKDMMRAELLKQQAMKYAKYTESGVIFEVGGVEISREKLAEKLQTDYPFLVDGNQSSGGGALGGGKGGGATKSFIEYNGAELSAIRKQDPAQYERMLSAHKATR
jgi:hypothetical protein